MIQDNHKKRILLLTRPICLPWDEASKNFAYTLARFAKDCEIHLLTFGKIAKLPENVVQHPIYSSSKWDFAQKLKAYLFLVKEFVFRGGNNYDILHSFFTPTKLNVSALKLCLRGKKTKTIQTLATLRDDLYSDEQIKSVIHADIIITYSDYAKDKLEKLGLHNVQRVYPGIDVKLFSPSLKDPGLMDKFKTGEEDLVINFAGEYFRMGGIDDVVEVFIELAQKHPKLKLHLAVRIKNEKDAVKKVEVRKKLEEAGLLSRVAFIDDGSYTMEKIFNLCDIFTFAVHDMRGKFDIPLAVIEAMACGKPVIASKIDRLEYFLNDQNSILIEPEDLDALKEKIEMLIKDPAKRLQLGEKGMAFVRENFDINKVVMQYEEIYKKL